MALQTALVSASIAAVVSLSVAVISPLFTHALWKRQKRKEQQLALAQRYAALYAELASIEVIQDEQDSRRSVAVKFEIRAQAFVIPVLFERKEIIQLAEDLLLLKDDYEFNESVRIIMQAHLFAEALDVPSKKFLPLAN